MNTVPRRPAPDRVALARLAVAVPEVSKVIHRFPDAADFFGELATIADGAGMTDLLVTALGNGGLQRAIEAAPAVTVDLRAEEERCAREMRRVS